MKYLKNIFPTCCLLTLVTTLANADVQTIFSFSKYKKSLERSPFHLNVVAQTVAANAKEKSDYALVGISKISGKSKVILVNKKTREYITVDENNGSKDGKIKIIKITSASNDPRESKVSIIENGTTFNITYDHGNKNKISKTKPYLAKKYKNKNRFTPQSNLNTFTPHKNPNQFRANNIQTKKSANNINSSPKKLISTNRKNTRRRKIIPQKWKKN